MLYEVITIADYSREQKTITLIYQAVGYSTRLLQQKQEGDYISDIAGPLGQPSINHKPKRVLGIGGGVGAAPLFPQIKQHFEENKAHVDVILGGRSDEYVILKHKYKEISNNLYFATDDGSLGTKGFVTDRNNFV